MGNDMQVECCSRRDREVDAGHAEVVKLAHQQKLEELQHKGSHPVGMPKVLPPSPDLQSRAFDKAALFYMGQAFLAKKRSEPGVIACPSGLLYEYIARGHGDRHPLPDTPCDIHYRGALIDGTVFFSSFKGAEPPELSAQQVIPGLSEGYQLMVEGDMIMFYIPSKLAYGDEGIDELIPPNADLAFEVHLLKIKGPSKPAEIEPLTSRTQPQSDDEFSRQLTASLRSLSTSHSFTSRSQGSCSTLSPSVSKARLVPKNSIGRTIEQRTESYAQPPTLTRIYVNAQPQTVVQQRSHVQPHRVLQQNIIQSQARQPNVVPQTQSSGHPQHMQPQFFAQRQVVGQLKMHQQMLPAYRVS